MKFVDLNYYYIHYCHTLHDAIQQFGSSFGYVPYIREMVDFHGIMHFNGQESINWESVPFTGFRSKNKFWYIPFKTHRYIRSLHPDVALVQGSIYPLQVIHLHLMLGKKCKIIVQHHGERPFQNPVKKYLQRLADKCISAYLFTSKKNAEPFVDEGVISSPGKCYEVLEASTLIAPVDREQARQQLGFNGSLNFLWVGRLNEGKDPFTVLNAFEEFAPFHPQARLHMLYQTDELLPGIKELLATNPVLANAVTLVGKVPHEQLAIWYSAADFYISGSHREGSGYGLIESMACGCIPVVTDIGPFKRIAGEHAFYYPPGNTEVLLHQLNEVVSADVEKRRQGILEHFHTHLSFRKIADDILTVVRSLT